MDWVQIIGNAVYCVVDQATNGWNKFWGSIPNFMHLHFHEKKWNIGYKNFKLAFF